MGEGMNYDEIADRILEAAGRLLIRYGYDKTTLDDIAREAGLSRSTLYTRWKKKDDLFHTLIWREGERYTDDFIARLEADPDGGTLAGFFHIAMSALHGNPFMATIYARERQILGAVMLQNNLTQVYQWRINATASFLGVLQQVGMIRNDVDLPTLSYLLSCLQLGILKMSEVIPTDQSPSMDALLDQSRQMLSSYAPAQEADREAARTALVAYMRMLRTQMNTMRDGEHPNIPNKDT
jgi:AcrR family transcriptional regulator